MIRLTRRYRIESAHQLTGMREGHKCARLHGHNYAIELTIESVAPHANGMVIDADDLDTAVLPVIRRLDHQTLNEACADGTPEGTAAAAQPTAENLAAYLLARLGFMSNSGRYRLASVIVRENEDLWAEARADAGGEK